MLVAQNLSLTVADEPHLVDVSFQMERGGLYTILGRTLAGKTTLLKSIAGLLETDSGQITLDGGDFSSEPVWRRNVAMVYQQFINYPHLSVAANIAFPLKKQKLDRAEIQSRVTAAMEQVGLQGFDDRKIQELSGGQQQRVAIARSLAKRSEILLLDEPLVNLDYKLREQLRDELKSLISAEFNTRGIVVYSTTDPREAMQFGGEVIVMDEGRVLQQGPAKDVFEHPATTRVAEITNDPGMNLWQADCDAGQFRVSETLSLPVPKHLSKTAAGPCVIGFRANDVVIDEAGSNFRVELSEISGSETILHLRQGESRMIARVEGVLDVSLDDQVPIRFKTDHLYAFSADNSLLHSPHGSQT